MSKLSIIICKIFLLSTVFLTSGFAVEPTTPSFSGPDWPGGYGNARRATSPSDSPLAKPAKLHTKATIHSIGIEWDLNGDSNHNATCKVTYKREDETGWHEAMPLMRIDYNGWYTEDTLADHPTNTLAGSILFLRPGTSYKIKLEAQDPDGWAETREIAIKTESWPTFKASRTFHIKPGATAGNGSEQQPFGSIEEADAIAKAGDLMLLHAGAYGKVTLKSSGREAGDASFIVWKSAGDGDATFEQIIISANYVWVEGLNFHLLSPDEHIKGIHDESGHDRVVIAKNKFTGYHYSVLLMKKSSNWTICDNLIEGDHCTGISGEGIELNKSGGHTVAFNTISFTADGMSYPRSDCDIFGNDIWNVSDDGIECDYGYANIRIWGNRIHAKNAAVSFQPMLSAPWYIIRNQCIVNRPAGLLKLRVVDRFVLVNNTFLGWEGLLVHTQDLLSATVRNNLWIVGGGNRPLWTAAAPKDPKLEEKLKRTVLFDAVRADWKTSVDYDGFDWRRMLTTPDSKIDNLFFWNGVKYTSLGELYQGVGIEAHAINLTADYLQNFKIPPTPEFFDPGWIAIKVNSQASDAGSPLPNIAEDFEGKAPDLGACEGSTPFHVGVRRAGEEETIDSFWILSHQRKTQR